MPTRRPTIVAHRGFHRDFPENSIEALAAAFRTGADVVEFDVRLTADRVPILMHDDTLDRTATARGHVAAAKWADLADQRLRHNDQPTACRIPRLSEAYLPIDGRAVDERTFGSRCFLVELKVVDRDLTRDVVKSRNAASGSVIVQSFDERVLFDALDADGECDLALLCGKPEDLAAAIGSRWKRLNLSHRLLTKELVRELKTSGRIVGAWTVNTEVELRGVISVGVDTIITDEPLLARRLVDDMCPAD